MSILSTAAFQQYALTLLQQIAGASGGIDVHSNLSTAVYRKYVLTLLQYIATNGGAGVSNRYFSQFTGNGITSSFYPINGFSTTQAIRYQVVIDGAVQEPNYSYDILADNGGTLLFPSPIYSGARISVLTQNT